MENKKSKIKFFFIGFVKIGLIYPPLLVLLKYLIFGETYLLGSFIEGLIFSFIFVGIMCLQHFSKLKKNGHSVFTDEDLAVNQTDNFELEITTDQLISKLENNPIENFKSMEVSGQSIQMRTRGHLDALSGEKIQIDFKDLDNGVKAISINSKPRIFFQLFDQGRNIINVQAIRNVIES